MDTPEHTETAGLNYADNPSKLEEVSYALPSDEELAEDNEDFKGDWEQAVYYSKLEESPNDDADFDTEEAPVAKFLGRLEKKRAK